MTSRLDAALAELAAAIADEVRAELRDTAGVPDRLLSIPEAAALLGIGRTALYAELAAGRIRSCAVGRRRLVPASAITERIEAATPARVTARKEDADAAAPIPRR